MAFPQVSYANLPFWNYLPMMVTNYGGDTQISTIPEYAGGNIGLYLNPMAQAQIPQTTWQGIPDFQINQQQVNDMADAMLNPVLNKLTSNTINTSLANIRVTTQRLNAKLQDSNITDADREKINELLDKLKEQEEKLKELVQSTDLDPKTANTKANEIESEIRKIVNEAAKIGRTNATDSTNNNNNADNNSNVDNNSNDNNNVDNNNNATGNASGTNENDNTNTNTSTETQGARGANTYSDAGLDLAERFYDATYRVGTDDAVFNEVCESLNKDNIMDVMLAWQDIHSTEKNESFMDAFMWDADRDQKIKYGKQIKRVLLEKARELGIMEECRADFAAIDKEMGSWFWVNNDVAKNYDNIIKKIAEKSGKTYNFGA